MRWLFQSYELNRIYGRSLVNAQIRAPVNLLPAVIRPIANKDELATSPDERIRSHGWYHSEQARGWGVWEGERLVCITWFWTTQDPRAKRKFPQMGDDEVVMMDLLTATEARGRNYAAALTQHAEQCLSEAGYRRAWTWVWHSNYPSQRVFAKAGWTYERFEIEILLRGLRTPIRIRLPSNCGL